MNLPIRTLILILLLPLVSIKLQAQDTKYSIDNGPIKNPRSWRTARGKYERADNRAKQKALRIRERQKKREAEGRKEMIKRHLSHQPPALRKKLEQESEAKSISYPEKEKKCKARKPKAKKYKP